MDSVPDKRARILAAASRLIVQNGLQCSMQAIADEAGVATGSLYNYFESKEALVRGVYGRVAEEMTASLSARDGAGAGEHQVRSYIAAYIDFIWQDPERARLFDYLDNNPLITPADARAIFGPFVQHAISMLRGAQAEGSVREGSAVLMASFLRGAIRNTLKRRRTLDGALTDAERELITSMCWRAIAAA